MSKIPVDQQDLLDLQHNAMLTYSIILELRIKSFNAPDKHPFRLTPVNPLEQDIQGQIIDYLRVEQARGRVVWFERSRRVVWFERSNGGGMKNPSGRVLRFYWLYLRGKIPRSKGKSDLSGMLMGGKFFAGSETGQRKAHQRSD
ncbi:MAG: hypothetical protein IPK63_19045 [Candidatus Competibacteraceae bacterium]|nr:hypothetical protein [Candidatus Competibacteraceae bacterium]